MESTWGSLIQSLGLPTAFLIIVIVAFVREYIVSGAAHRREIAQIEKSCSQLVDQYKSVNRDLIFQRNTLLNISSNQSQTAKSLLPLAEQAVHQ